MSAIEVYLISLAICIVFGLYYLKRRIKQYKSLDKIEKENFNFGGVAVFAMFSLMPASNIVLAIVCVASAIFLTILFGTDKLIKAYIKKGELNDNNRI